MQDYFTSILRYAYHNDISIKPDEAKVLLKEARALSKERGYNVFNVTKKCMTGIDAAEELANCGSSSSDSSSSCGRATVSSKDSRDLKRLLTTIFHNDILEAVFNAEKA